MNDESVWKSVLDAILNPSIGAVINFRWGFIANPEERTNWDGSFEYTEKGWIAKENYSQQEHEFFRYEGLGFYNLIVGFTSGKDCCVQLTLIER